MKKLFFPIALIALSSSYSFAQKFSYVDTEYILAHIPEYKQAQAELDKTSIGWQKEIEGKYAEIDKLYKNFQAEQILLTEDMKKKREAEITGKEKEVKDIQKQHFGVEGDLFKKRQELVKPIQDKVYNAVKDIAEKQNYSVIFDKASEMTMLYTNPKFDKSDEVLEALGYKGDNKNDKDKKKK